VQRGELHSASEEGAEELVDVDVDVDVVVDGVVDGDVDVDVGVGVDVDVDVGVGVDVVGDVVGADANDTAIRCTTDPRGAVSGGASWLGVGSRSARNRRIGSAGEPGSTSGDAPRRVRTSTAAPASSAA
jgi:hypothetical protein